MNTPSLVDPSKGWDELNQKQVRMLVITRVLEIGIAIIQLVDIVIHAAAHQVELLRVLANLIMLVWVAVVASGKINQKFLQTAESSIGGYLVINVIFLMTKGLSNPAQGGELRITLFILMILTILFSVSLTFIYAKWIKK